jgi:hypothetical protein
MATELDKISGKKPCQLWIKAHRFGHHHSHDDGGGDGLRNAGLLSTTDTAYCPRIFYLELCWLRWAGLGLYFGWGKQNIYRTRVGKLLGKMKLVKNLEKNVETDLREIGSMDVYWIKVALDRGHRRNYVVISVKSSGYIREGTD